MTTRPTQTNPALIATGYSRAAADVSRASESMRAALGAVDRDVRNTGRTAQAVSRSISGAFVSAFKDATIEGRKFSDVLRGLALRLSDIALRAAIKPLEGILSGAISGTIGGIAGGIVPNANGNAIAAGRVRAFARGASLAGGIVTQPSLFPMAGGAVGLVGEAGPEAILPLSRGPDGRLGVRSDGRSATRPVTVVINTADAESFRRSEAQVTATLARAVARGQRNL